MNTNQTVQQWSVEKLKRLLGIYMVTMGVVVLLNGNNRLNGPSNLSLRDFANLVDLTPRSIVFCLFCIPGVLLFFKRTCRAGLLFSVMMFAMFVVGNIRSILMDPTATVMAATNYSFLTFLSSWLLSTEKYVSKKEKLQ